MLIDGELDVIALRQSLDHALESSTIGFKPGRAATTGDNFLRFSQHGNL